MTSKEIIHRILEKQGLQVTKGRDDMLDPVLPWFIMDIQYQLFCKVIKPLNCGHDLQKFRTRWNESYNIFNKSMFCMFNDDEKLEIVDMMDDFENYIANDVEIAKIQFMNVLGKYELEIQDIIATGMMCNVLSQSANIIFKRIYAVGHNGKHQENRYISSVEAYSYKFVNLLHQSMSDEVVKFSDVKPLDDAIKVLHKKIIKWLKTH